jgi:hypothetical protein
MFELPDLAHLFPAATRPKVAARVLAKLLPTIEHAISNGFTHAQVHAWLQQQGVVMQFRYYENALHRLRKKGLQAVHGAAQATVPGSDAEIIGATPRELAEPIMPGLDARPKTIDLSQAIASTADESTSTILGKDAPRQKFRWDPKGAEKLSLMKLQG